MKVYKGVTEKMTYYFPLNESVYYDLRYDFPNCIFDGEKANQKPNIELTGSSTMKAKRTRVQTTLTEVKVASNSKAVLGISLEKSLTL